MPIGGRDPKTIDWHKFGRPIPIKEKLRYVRVTSGLIAAMGLVLFLIGYFEDFLAFQISGILFILTAFNLLILWEVAKRDYAKNYKKNLLQWKKTKKNNTGRY
ncbi:MAG: hypothetical protein DPW16_08055 [Chloroflexi bacterium]|nr:hypothetical protein [Chloroflexota bacterium]